MTGIGMGAGTRDTIAMIAIITDTGIMDTSTMVKSVVNVVKVIFLRTRKGILALYQSKDALES